MHIDGTAHNARDEQVIFQLLNDRVKPDRKERELPMGPVEAGRPLNERHDHRRDGSQHRSQIRDDFQHPGC